MSRSYSIVICTLNRAAFLANAIEASRRVRWPNIEIIVVNGPSTDNTDAVVDRFTDVKLVHCPEPNLSMSRNIGIAASRGDIVAFLDDDGVPEPNWIARIDPHYDDPIMGGIGGYIIDHTGVHYQCKAVVCDRLGDSQGFDNLREALAAQDGGRSKYLSQTGANSTFRRRALLDIGGFDETFTYFLDETDVNLRLIDAGWQITYAPGALVHHKYAPSAERDHRRVPKSLYAPARSKAYFAVTHTRGQTSLHSVLHHLVDHSIELSGHNKNLLNDGLIDETQHERLEKDVETGLKDGIARALACRGAEVMSQATLDRFKHEIFRPITPRLAIKERLRIALVSREYPPKNVGGIGVWTEVLASQLARDGHEVSVVTLSDQHHTVDFENGVWVHRIVPNHQPHRNDPQLPDLPQTIKDHAYSVFDEVMRIRRDRGLDIASWPIWDLEGIALSKSPLIPTILTLHTTYALAKPHKPDWHRSPEYLERHVDKIIAREREILQETPFVLANSSAVLLDIEKEYDVSMSRTGVEVIPHGIRAADLGYQRRSQHRNDKELRLLFVGRLEKRKGADTLIAALPAVFRQLKHLRVDIVGAPAVDMHGKTLMDDFVDGFSKEPWFSRVEFHGELCRDDLEARFATCDLFVAPSRYESFGLVFLEAMKYGKPCIGTDIGGISEVVQSEVTGLLVPPGSVEALSRAVIELGTNADKRFALGAAGLRRFEDKFTSKQQANAFSRYCRNVIEAHEERI